MHIILDNGSERQGVVLTDNEFLLLKRASEVTRETIGEFVKRAAIEEADGLAHMHSESGE